MPSSVMSELIAEVIFLGILGALCVGLLWSCWFHDGGAGWFLKGLATAIVAALVIVVLTDDLNPYHEVSGYQAPRDVHTMPQTPTVHTPGT